MPPSAIDLLDRYDRGEPDAVVQLFLAARDVGALRNQLESKGAAWTMAAGPAAEPRRRLVAATMALELANARLEDEWMELRTLIEWGCGLLRRGPPTAAERVWQLAAVAVTEGALDTMVLFRISGATAKTYHLAHAMARFPDEPRFPFVERFAVPQIIDGRSNPSLAAGLEPEVGRRTIEPLAVQSVTMAGVGRGFDADRFPSDQAKARDTAVQRLKAVMDDPAVGAEAALRAGHLLLIGLDLAEALEAFQAAARTSPSPYVSYLAHFLMGRTLERLDRPGSAEQSYGRALAAMPHAQSAVLARAALLVRAGRTAEATALTEAMFAARPRPPDPWRLFPYGDYYRWPALVTALRAEAAR